MLMKIRGDCACQHYGELVNISEWHQQFADNYRLLDQHARQQLRQCPQCDQLWRLDNDGIGKMAYALQLDLADNWQAFDASALIKAQMLANRGGYADTRCRRKPCDELAINGSIYCLEHLYQSGARL